MVRKAEKGEGILKVRTLFACGKKVSVDSLDGLDRLLEAEKRATEFLHGAETEAGLLVGKAQEEAKKTEKQALVDAKTRLEREAERREAEAEASLKTELEGYRSALEALPRDQAAFGRVCSQTLFPGD